MTEAGADSGVIEIIHQLIEWAALGIEVLAVAIIVAAVIVVAVSRGTVFYLFRPGTPWERYKFQLAKALLLGLEFLVAADVVRTVALTPTLHNVAVLGLLVVIRTFLSWSLVVEIEERWPWQPQAAARSRGASEPVGDRAPDA